VQLQADAPFRSDPKDLGQVYVRSAKGAIIPVAALITVQSVLGPEQLDRFNGFLAAKVLGNSLPGIRTRAKIN
jgi:multidrug efflux pump subunit AcrB